MIRRTIARFNRFQLAVFFVCLCWPLMALAAGAPPTPDTNAAEWLKALYTALTDGAWKPAGGLIALGIVYLLRRFGPKWVKGRVAGYVVNGLVSLLTTVGTALAVGANVTFATVMSALGTAATATGLWELLKDTGVATPPPPPTPAPTPPPALTDIPSKLS
jgi:hypothetical protein